MEVASTEGKVLKYYLQNCIYIYEVRVVPHEGTNEIIICPFSSRIFSLRVNTSTFMCELLIKF